MKLKGNLSLSAIFALILFINCGHAREELKVSKNASLPIEEINELTHERVFRL